MIRRQFFSFVKVNIVVIFQDNDARQSFGEQQFGGKKTKLSWISFFPFVHLLKYSKDQVKCLNAFSCYLFLISFLQKNVP